MFVNSGTTALYVTLMALKGLSDRKEVILPAYTAPSLILPIRKAGLEPKLCDISLDTFNFDLDALSLLVTENTLCVIPVHMFGLACDMGRINKIANKKGVYVIEDAASSLGTIINNKNAGAFGDVGFYSLNRGKNLSTLSGGCIVTGLEDVQKLISAEIDKIRKPGLKLKIGIMVKTVALALAVRPLFFTIMRRLISKFKYTTLHTDFDSFKYTRFQAGVGLSLFKKADKIFEERNKKGRFLRDQLNDVEGLVLPEILRHSEPAYNQFPIVLKDSNKRDLLYFEINRQGVECTILYPDPVHKAHDLGYGLANDPFPSASYMAKRLLLIPTHPLISFESLKVVVDVIKSNI